MSGILSEKKYRHHIAKIFFQKGLSGTPLSVSKTRPMARKGAGMPLKHFTYLFFAGISTLNAQNLQSRSFPGVLSQEQDLGGAGVGARGGEDHAAFLVADVCTPRVVLHVRPVLPRRNHDHQLTDPPGHLWRDTGTNLSGPLSQPASNNHKEGDVADVRTPRVGPQPTLTMRTRRWCDVCGASRSRWSTERKPRASQPTSKDQGGRH